MSTFETVVLTLNEPNKNNHMYPAAVVQKAIDKVGGREILGGLMDEAGFSTSINLERVTHQVTGLRIEGDKVYGTVTILDMPLSNVVSALVTDHIGGFRISCFCNTTKRDDDVIEISDMTIRSVDYCNEPA